MKSSIGIAFLLLFASAQSVSGVNENPPNELEIRDQINRLNKERLALAQKEQIANMHEVTYDKTLADKVKKMTCDDVNSNSPDYVVFDSIEIVSAYMLKLKDEGDLTKSPLFHPLQTKIACGITMCNDRKGICLMGPKNSPVKKADIKPGSPGTGCSGGNGASGLCMGGGVSSASTPMTLLSLVIALIMA